MKSSLLIATITLLMTSCATSNYGKLKFSRAQTSNSTEVDVTQMNENTVEKVVLKDKERIESQKNISIQETFPLESIEDETVDSEKKKRLNPLRKKLNEIQMEQREEIASIHLEENDAEKKQPKKNTAKLERLAFIYGWLSLIPLPLIGWIFSFLAIITGAIVINRIKKHPKSFKSYSKKASTALSLGILTLVIWGIIILLMMASW